MHMLRMKDDRLTKSVHQGKPSGKRSRGRPNKRRMDYIEEHLRQAGVTKCGKTVGREKVTLNVRHCCRQTTVQSNLTAASLAEISWTMNTLT